ncbi:MAG: BLUF domain-containing protein [Caulobacter sp.]|nr:BLUF domain-containing protein [Caulobacter sp.]
MSVLSSSSRSPHRLIYCSRSLLKPEGFAEAVEAIIRTSIRNNRRDNVSGLLFCHAGWFLQALEGSSLAVQTALGRIGSDPRHEAVKVLGAGPAETRLFREWDMCARTLSMVDDEVANTLERRGPFDPGLLSGVSATRLLSTLRDVRADAAQRIVA